MSGEFSWFHSSDCKILHEGGCIVAPTSQELGHTKHIMTGAKQYIIHGRVQHTCGS